MTLQVLAAYSPYICYFDTDSVFMNLPPGVAPPETSTGLGRLKDEVVEEFGPEACITSFHSLGPKSYTYRYSSSSNKNVVPSNIWIV